MFEKNINKPTVVFIGGIEVGKTSTLEALYDDVATSLDVRDKTIHATIREMIPGREYVDYYAVELPRILYSSNDWYKNETVKSTLEKADVIVYITPINDISILSHQQYLCDVFDSLSLKRNVIFLIGLSKADILLTPNVAKKQEIAKSKRTGLKTVTNLTKKICSTFSLFSDFNKIDRTFSPSSIIPYSCALNWNLEELQYQIWNGIVISMNDYVYDESLPTLVLAGKTGCGKTSTINILWNKDLAVDRAVSCTKFPAVMHIEDTYEGHSIEFNLVDLPGIAESLEANTLYRSFYYKYIKQAKVQVCLTQADRRAYKQDELFYSELIRNGILTPEQNIILGINQADLLFKTTENLSGIDLHSLPNDDSIIQEKISDCYNGIFKDVFRDFDKVSIDSVHIYSVYQKWNTDTLKSKIYKLLNI